MKMIDDNNTFYEDSVCSLCSKLVDEPLMFVKCQHACCRTCFTEKYLRTELSGTCCPSCQIKCEVVSAPVLLNLVRSLRVKCLRGCGTLVELGKFTTHHQDCDSVAVINDVVVNGLRYLYASVDTNILELKTGGQVCILKILVFYIPFIFDCHSVSIYASNPAELRHIYPM